MQSYYTNIAKLTEDSNKMKKKITLKSLSDDVQDLKNIMQETLKKIGDALSMEDGKGAGTSKDKNLTVKGSNANKLSKKIAGGRNKKKKKTSLSSLGSDVKDLNKIANALSMEDEKDASKPKENNVSDTSSKARRHSKKIAEDGNKKKKKISHNSQDDKVQDLNHVEDAVSVKDGKDYRKSNEHKASDTSSNVKTRSKEIAKDRTKKKEKIPLNSMFITYRTKKTKLNSLPSPEYLRPQSKKYFS